MFISIVTFSCKSVPDQVRENEAKFIQIGKENSRPVDMSNIEDLMTQANFSDCMAKAEITGIAPFFIVKDVAAALKFYRDQLGFEITFQGPTEDNIFFGIIQRGTAMIILKAIGVDPVPNYTRDIKGHCPLGRLPSCP